MTKQGEIMALVNEFIKLQEGDRKREEIREGIKPILEDIVSLEDPHSGRRIQFIDITDEDIDKVFRYLHSQGVVIKVDRELPVYLEYFTNVKVSLDNDLLENAGYVAVEPLTKEPDGNQDQE